MSSFKSFPMLANILKWIEQIPSEITHKVFFLFYVRFFATVMEFEEKATSLVEAYKDEVFYLSHVPKTVLIHQNVSLLSLVEMRIKLNTFLSY